jgi:hypothetical protein
MTLSSASNSGRGTTVIVQVRFWPFWSTPLISTSKGWRSFSVGW